MQFKKIKLLILACAILSTMTACKTEGNADNEKGLAYYKKGQYNSAITSFEAAIATNKQEPDFYTNLGMTYIELDNFDAAITQFELALELDSNHRLAMRGMGIVNLALGNYEEAARYFSEALTLADGTLTELECDLVDYRALTESKLGRYDAAIESYSTLIEVKYREGEHYYLRGQVYLLAGKYEEALSDFNNAVSFNKSSCALYLNIYNALTNAGYVDDARHFLGQALTNNALGDDYSTGLIYFFLDDYTNALLKLAPATIDNTEAYLYLGKCYYSLGDTEKARSTFKQYLNYNNTNGYVHNLLGLMSISENDYTSALNHFQNGILTNDTSAMKELKWNEFICYEKLRDFDTALEKITAYLEAYPDDEAARKEYEFLKTR